MKIIKFFNKLKETLVKNERTCIVPCNLFTINILQCLKDNNLVREYRIFLMGSQKKIQFELFFDELTKKAYIKDIEIFSKKSNKIFLKLTELFLLLEGKKSEILILSTSSGIKTGEIALKEGIGGEYLLKILL